MLRFLLPVASLLIASFSILVDAAHPSSTSSLCSLGLCRFDQLFSSIDSKGIQAGNMAALVREDPSNPLVWCTYAEVFASHGDAEKAQAAFERAITLGPGMAPVLMRAANFDFSHGRTAQGLGLARQIMNQTGEFDEILFSYFLHSGVAAPELLKTAVPAEPRPARSWLVWASRNGLTSDLPAIWTWMIQNHLLDQKTAADVAQDLWRQTAFQPAQQLWTDWLGASRGDYPDPQGLWDRHFRGESGGSPFDWTLNAPAGDVSMSDGLEIHLSGDANVNVDVHEFATVKKGRYRFSAEIAADGLAGGEYPEFHIFDASTSQHLDVHTPPIKGTVPRSWVNLEFNVPSGTKALEIQLERRAQTDSRHRIGTGTLHVYQVSLVRPS
jgi:hypothetical protein